MNNVGAFAICVLIAGVICSTLIEPLAGFNMPVAIPLLGGLILYTLLTKMRIINERPTLRIERERNVLADEVNRLRAMVARREASQAHFRRGANNVPRLIESWADEPPIETQETVDETFFPRNVFEEMRQQIQGGEQETVFERVLPNGGQFRVVMRRNDNFILHPMIEMTDEARAAANEAIQRLIQNRQQGNENDAE